MEYDPSNAGFDQSTDIQEFRSDRAGLGVFKARARQTDAVVHAIGDALRAVAADECFNYFLSCGYVD
ncbi:MAG: hypothetical protein WC975_07615 [Phycisphaerae bacterium]